MARRSLPPLEPLLAFEAAARHLSFTKAGDELALTQSAVSRQIQALEGHYGVPLFQRLHRALRLTPEGEQLQSAVAAVLRELNETGERLRRASRPKTVVVTTTPGFAGLWLIPRLPGFTAARPEVDVRISASYVIAQLERDGIDLAIRYHTEQGAGAGAQRLFGEVMLPVCSPALRDDPQRPLRVPSDLERHVLLDADASGGGHLIDWSLWLQAIGLPRLKPAGMLHFSLYDQLIQAAVNGQGVALGRRPLVDELLEQGRLALPFDAAVATPRSYYLIESGASASKPEVREFVDWLRAEAAGTPAADQVPTARGRGSADRPGRAPA